MLDRRLGVWVVVGGPHLVPEPVVGEAALGGQDEQVREHLRDAAADT